MHIERRKDYLDEVRINMVHCLCIIIIIYDCSTYGLCFSSCGYVHSEWPITGMTTNINAWPYTSLHDTFIST